MYVMAKGYYGLGGNLAVLVCAMRLALKTNRKLIVDWKNGFYGGESHDVFLELFQYPGSEEVAGEVLGNYTVWPEYWRPHISKTKPHVKGIALSNVTAEMVESEIDAGGGLADIVVISRDDKYWHRSEYHKEMSQLTKSLRPTADIQKRIDMYKEECFSGQVIGVHFRHGNGERSVIPAEIEWFFSSVDKFISETPEARIFLCTDCYAVVDSFKERYKGRVFYVEKAYPPLGVGGMHYASSDVGRLRSAIEALIDIWLLSECDKFVGSKSFFSGVANKLNAGFDRSNSAWWMPKHRSYVDEADKSHVSAVSEVSKFFTDRGIPLDGVYLKKSGMNDYDVYYLYENVGKIGIDSNEVAINMVFENIKQHRLY